MPFLPPTDLILRRGEKRLLRRVARRVFFRHPRQGQKRHARTLARMGLIHQSGPTLLITQAGRAWLEAFDGA